MREQTSRPTDPIVEVRNVAMRYGSGDTTVDALRPVNLRVHAGELTLIVGPSGSGKTTLLSILGLLLRPSAGQILVRGRDVTTLGERELPAVRAATFGFVFQGFNLFAALTALENVALSIRLKDPKRPDPEGEARRLLEAVGLGERLHALPETMSGGQKQRVAIARALGGGPPLILGDEPTAALDSKTALAVMDLLRDRARNEGRGVVVVTHDRRLDRYADRVVRVDDGLVSDGVPANEAAGAVA